MVSSASKSIIALLPHPDDEIGMAGTLAAHAMRGDIVNLIYLTYGELTTKFKDQSMEEIINIRKTQAEDVSQILGAQKPIFLNMGDSKISDSRDSSLELANLIARLKPDVIITWGSEAKHPDHKNTNSLLRNAISYARIPKLMENNFSHRSPIYLFYYYDDSSSLPVKFIDVTDSMNIALECGEYYGSFFNWKNVSELMKSRRKSRGMECQVAFAEKYNYETTTAIPSKYLV